MRPSVPTIVALGAPLALAGCLNTHNETVLIRRDQEVLDRQREAQTTSREVILERRADEREAARLPRELKDSSARLAASRAAVARAARVSDDPWRDYEQDRRDTFYRAWPDIGRDLPPLEPDASGPPGWLGPKLPSAVSDDPHALPPEAEPEGEAPADDGGGWDDDGGSDDGGWGGDDDGGWGDDGGDDDGGWGGGGDDGGWGGGDDGW